MGKYDTLVKYLNETNKNTVTLTFEQLGNVVEDMPVSAWVDRTWWGNSKHPSRVQAAAWMGAGWKVDGSEFSSGRITFNRIRGHIYSSEEMREIADGYDDEVGWKTDFQRSRFNKHGILMLKQLLNEFHD